MLKLYDYFRSSAAFRVRIALNYKGLPFGKIPIDLRTNAQGEEYYKNLNPEGLIPSLDDNGDTIAQSLAIIEYLDEKYHTMPLLPKDTLSRAYVRSIALNICCDIHPLNNLRVRKYLTNDLKCTTEEGNNWYNHWISIGLTGLEKQINSSNYYTGKLCYKNEFSIADICLIPQLFNLRRFMADLGIADESIELEINTKYPTLSLIEENCKKLDAVQLAWPKE